MPGKILQYINWIHAWNIGLRKRISKFFKHANRKEHITIFGCNLSVQRMRQAIAHFV